MPVVAPICQLRKLLGNSLPCGNGHRIGFDRQSRNARSAENLDNLLMNKNTGPADIHLQAGAFFLDLGENNARR